MEIAASLRQGALTYSAAPKVDFSFAAFALDIERSLLRRRIDARLESRLEAGLVREVQGLLDSGISPDRLKSLGMEYREITAFILGEKPYSAMVGDLKHEIHLLAKRQETYFRGMAKRGIPLHCLPPGTALAEILRAWENAP